MASFRPALTEAPAAQPAALETARSIPGRALASSMSGSPCQGPGSGLPPPISNVMPSTPPYGLAPFDAGGNPSPCGQQPMDCWMDAVHDTPTSYCTARILPFASSARPSTRDAACSRSNLSIHRKSGRITSHSAPARRRVRPNPSMARITHHSTGELRRVRTYRGRRAAGQGVATPKRRRHTQGTGSPPPRPSRHTQGTGSPPQAGWPPQGRGHPTPGGKKILQPGLI